MYCRNDQREYYKNVLVPLEMDTIRRRRIKELRRKSKPKLENMRAALRNRQFRKLYRIAIALLKSVGTIYKSYKAEYKHPHDISPEELCFSDKRVAVYTAVFGNYDRLWEPLFCPDNVDYFIFTDGEIPAGSKWVKSPWEGIMDAGHMTGTEKNRYLKMHPHLLFPEYEYSVYIDGNILVTADLTVLAMQTADFPVAMHIHKDRDCVYEEIDKCIEKHKDTPEALSEQRTVLQHMGIPEHWGLLEAPVIARRHHEPVCKEIMKTWWTCFCEGCNRDQIALIRCLWELQINPRKLGSLGTSVMTNSKFIWNPH